MDVRFWIYIQDSRFASAINEYRNQCGMKNFKKRMWEVRALQTEVWRPITEIHIINFT